MKYEENTPEESCMASEPVAAYQASPHTRQLRNAQPAQDFARSLCYTSEEYAELEAHNFYRDEIPAQPQSEAELMAELNQAEAEGYVSDAEVEHIMNLWKHVG